MISSGAQLEQNIEHDLHRPADVTANPLRQSEHEVAELQVIQLRGHGAQLEVLVLKN